MKNAKPQKYYSVKIGVDPVCPVPTNILEMSIGGFR